MLLALVQTSYLGFRVMNGYSLSKEEADILYNIWKLRGTSAHVPDYISAIKNYRAKDKENLSRDGQVQMDKN